MKVLNSYIDHKKKYFLRIEVLFLLRRIRRELSVTDPAGREFDAYCAEVCALYLLFDKIFVLIHR